MKRGLEYESYEFKLDVVLEAKTPNYIINILYLMINGEYTFTKSIKLPDHEFFRTNYWRNIIDNNDAEKASTLERDSRGYYHLHMFNPDISNNEWEIYKFLSFINEYTLTTGICGYITRNNTDDPVSFTTTAIVICEEYGENHFELYKLSRHNKIIISSDFVDQSTDFNSNS
jgi:hypothetical protein